MFHLLPPIDEVVARRKATRLREQATEISGYILEEMLSSLPLEEDTEASAGVDTREEFGDKEKTSSGSLAVVEAEPQSGDMDLSVHDEVSDEDREADRDIRHRILLGLLQLACAMVSPSALTQIRIPKHLYNQKS